MNEVRGLLGEYGIILPQGVEKFRTALVHTLEAEQVKLTPAQPGVVPATV